MNRKQAIKIIVEHEYKDISEEDRSTMIFNAWGLNQEDGIFHLLPPKLREELTNYEEPQSDPMSSYYNILVQVLCEDSYSEYSNEKLASIVSSILKREVTVEGEQIERFTCPCCGEKSLPHRGEYDICPRCGWEDDGIQEEEKYSNPNHMTLKKGRENYILHGRCRENSLQ